MSSLIIDIIKDSWMFTSTFALSLLQNVSVDEHEESPFHTDNVVRKDKVYFSRLFRKL